LGTVAPSRRVRHAALRVLLASLATVYVVWGSTYLAIRVMVETVPPLLGAGLRFLAAGALLALALVALGGAGRLRLPRAQVASAAATGSLILVGGIGLLTVAEQDAPSGFAALIVASVPVWVVVLRALARERVAKLTVAGTLLGLGGVVAVIGASPAGAAAWAVAALVAAAILTAIGAFVSPRLALPPDAFAATVVEMLVAGAVLTAAGLAAGEAGDVAASTLSTDSLLAFGYLVVFGSIVAYTAFVWLREHAPVSLVATYAFVNPVVALVLGWLLLDEELTVGLAAGAAAIVLSVIAVQREDAER
jgi:drug/metabolite transporter (DMT)-like permease